MQSYDEPREKINEIEKELKEYLLEIRKIFKDNTIEYAKVQSMRY